MNFTDSCYVRPSENELIETVIHVKSDPRPAIVGTVVDSEQHPIADALVCLFLSGGDAQPDAVVGSLFTDETGQFSFGPLEAGRLYAIRVCKTGGKRRKLE